MFAVLSASTSARPLVSGSEVYTWLCLRNPQEPSKFFSPTRIRTKTFDASRRFWLAR
jgi:hypothetical protein